MDPFYFVCLYTLVYPNSILLFLMCLRRVPCILSAYFWTTSSNTNMPNGPVNNEGEYILFSDTGPVQQKDDYTTLVVVHGTSFNSGELF